MNPYHSPQTTSEIGERRRYARDPGVVLVVAVLLTGCVACAATMFTSSGPAIRSFALPRFGWSGLMGCGWPLIFLIIWLVSPQKMQLLCAATMCFFVAGQQAVELLNVQTVAVVDNVFHDRLHSSWAWSVAPFLVAGVYLCWVPLRDCRRGPGTSRAAYHSSEQEA